MLQKPALETLPPYRVTIGQRVTDRNLCSNNEQLYIRLHVLESKLHPTLARQVHIGDTLCDQTKDLDQGAKI